MAKIKHCVYLQMKPAYGQADWLEVFQKLADLQPIMPGFLSIEFGKNLDCENKSECNVGFIIDFTDIQALENYANHPEHQKIGAQLVEMTVGGADAIMVYDLSIA
ncbi:MAG: Dabb family protein [Hyphomicrobiales bacterium]